MSAISLPSLPPAARALTPAFPLAFYFCVYTMLAVAAQFLGIQHPAYWIFGYLALCIVARAATSAPELQPVDVILGIFVTVILASWMTTGMTGGTRVLAYISSSIVLPWVAARLFTNSDMRIFLICAAAFGAAIAVLYLLAVPFLPSEDVAYERVNVFGGQAAYGVIGPTVGLLLLASSVYLISAPSARLTTLAIGAVPLSAIVVVHMGARGMLVSVIAALALSTFLLPASRIRKTAVWMLFIASVGVGLSLVPEPRFNHFARLVVGSSALQTLDRATNDTVVERLLLWRESVEMFIAHPHTGVGVGRFSEHSVLDQEFGTPHSTAFHVLAELGIAGASNFAAICLYLIVLAITTLRSGKTVPALVAALWLYYLIYDQISANYLTSLRFYLFSALLVTVVTRRSATS